MTSTKRSKAVLSDSRSNRDRSRVSNALGVHSISNVPYHLIFLEGVYLDRTDQGRKPRFLKVEVPTDSDITDVVQQSSRRVIRTLCRLGYLEAGIDDAMATGYDPIRARISCKS